jgi:hypothetical protein
MVIGIYSLPKFAVPLPFYEQNRLIRSDSREKGL